MHYSLPRPVAITSEIEQVLDVGAAVVCSVSGGKDGTAASLAVWHYLDLIGHTGPRGLAHADLGIVEWAESLPECRKLATYLKTDLLVVGDPSNGLMERWESRWQSSLRRYANLETVTLVLPWSTASMRFCTSEKKAAPLNSAITRRYKGMPIVSVTGIRREESPARAKALVGEFDVRASRRDTPVYAWRPILEYSVAEVFDLIMRAGLDPHEAYTRYGSSRLSCRFCMLASLADHVAALRDPAAHDLYRRMVSLEAASSFSFQSHRWLGDLAPELLPDDLLGRFEIAKGVAKKRTSLEGTIPKSMLYEKGWPTRVLTGEEAAFLANIRRQISNLIGISSLYLDGPSIIGRYEELMAGKPKAKEGMPLVDVA